MYSLMAGLKISEEIAKKVTEVTGESNLERAI